MTEHYVLKLRALVSSLGRDGGLISPSVYESAQTLRFCPGHVDSESVTEWLLSRQQADGGWGPRSAPLHRDAPTLAAMLALQGRTQTSAVRRAVDAGCAFLEQQAPFDQRSVALHSMPIAVELIVPRLLDEADELGLHVDRTPYAALEALGVRRRKLIEQLKPQPNTPPTLSWEAWGEHPDPDLVDPVAGVGHSPAATARWLQLAGTCSRRAEARRLACAYIERASLATNVNIRGVVPFALPITRFEQAFVLHTLAIADLLDHPGLRTEVRRQLEALRGPLQHGGLGFSDRFLPDGDDTAAGIGALAAAGMQVDSRALKQFERCDHFVAYPFEMHGSITLTARAVHALALLGHDVRHLQRTVVHAQCNDGWWSGDKWNMSRLYGTAIALLALPDEEFLPAKQAAWTALITHQNSDGGWSDRGASTPIETAYGMLALYRLAKDGLLDQIGVASLKAASRYLMSTRRYWGEGKAGTWVGKDLFSAFRIDATTIISALLTATAVVANSPTYKRRRPLRRTLERNPYVTVRSQSAP